MTHNTISDLSLLCSVEGGQTVIALVGVRSYALSVRKTADVFMQLDELLKPDSYWVSHQGKPIRPGVEWPEYAVRDHGIIVVHPRLRGGAHASCIRMHAEYFKAPIKGTTLLVEAAVRPSFLVDLGKQTVFPWLKPFSERAKEFVMLKEYMDLPRRTPTKSPDKEQRELGRPNGHLETQTDCNEHLQAFSLDPKHFLDKHTDPEVLSFLEDVVLLCLQLIRSKDVVDKMLAVTVFLKLRTGSSLVTGVASIVSDVAFDLFSSQLQSVDSALDSITDLRSLISQWESLQHSALVQQVMKLYKYAIALGVFSLVGITIDEKVANDCKKELDSPMLGPNFMVTMIDTVSLLIQRCLLFAKTGCWQTLVYGPKQFGAWFDMCQKVKREFQYRGDLESQGTSYHKFVGDLKQCVEEGRAILKFGNQTSGMELMGVKKLLNDMLMMQAELSTFREAQKSRRPPFGLLVYGKTCVGKSTFTSMLYQFAGKFWDLPTTDEYRYTRNTVDDFWSGWDSMKWFLLLDDIAFGDPNSKVVDNSLTEVIQIMNDVPLVPNQASLEDKGRNPLRARMVVATTNTKHLNAHAYFACPVAVQRRFPFVLGVTPKRKYAREDDWDMIDPAKLPPIVDDWPDFWNIRVERVVAAGETQAKYELVQEFTSTEDFFKWLGEAMRLFESIQRKAGAGILAMQELELCRSCGVLTRKCPCAPVVVDKAVMQADEDLPVDVTPAGTRVAERTLPAGHKIGDTFTKIVEAGLHTYEYHFSPHASGDSNYILKTIVWRYGSVLREFVTPIKLVEEKKTKLQASDADMADVLAEILRIQGRRNTGRVLKVVHWFADVYLRAYVRSRLVRSISNTMMEWSLPRKLLLYGFRWYTRERSKYYVWVASLLEFHYIPRRWRYVLISLSAASAAFAAYKVYSSFAKPVQYEGYEPGQTPFLDKDGKVVSVMQPDGSMYYVDPLEVQGLRQSVPDEHFPKTERPNVWKRDDYQTSSIDRSDLSASFADLPYDQLVKVVERNTARIRVESNGLIVWRYREGNAFSPCGHLWMTNNHTLYKEGDVDITLSVMPHVQGASSNVKFKLRQEDILRFPERDLAFFEVHSWETKRDLRSLIRKPTLKGAYTATYVTRSKGLDTKVTRIKCAVQSVKRVDELDIELSTWSGFTDTPTVLGDCGSPMFVHKPVTAIMGIHTLGSPQGYVWATEIDTDIVDQAVLHFDMPVVQCSSPVIDAPSRPKKLVELRQRSPLRWLEEGSLNVYGSYAGPQFTSRSKVRPTLLGAEILEERKWQVDFAAPDLRDYRPWRLALIDSTQKNYGGLSGSMMKAIAQAYTDDILECLPEGALGLLEPLSDRATVNGIPGVRFIDKMNFKSSMGEPYNKTKKAFLRGVEGDMRFDHEVMQRIERIKRLYANKQRACPVFSGQLKDEPRPIPKVKEGKIRVFTAAPADWSFVVRKYLLPVVKVMQENPFVFEASVGCTVQSLEWQSYYLYLTHFGVHRMVAGDYGKFDKKMEALIILLAFRVLRNLCKAAGWTEDELGVIDCIAEDTAYAFVNFDGDLVEFFGSNPSGHPLTVIINCIANALYMRLAFVKLCPFSGSIYSRARRFKEFVRLLTYGDDNVMGVSRDANWFNHTAIQKAMSDIGVEYTMADKESHSLPFIHIKDVSYLKRTWRWDEDVGAIVPPLDIASIHKMLTICNPSGDESPELHMASVMNSAINEWFWYGKAKFEEERAWMWSLAEKHDLTVELKFKGFPTWDELNQRFWSASKGVVGAEIGCESEHPRSLLPN